MSKTPAEDSRNSLEIQLSTCPEKGHVQAKELLEQGVHGHAQTSAEAAVVMGYQQLAIYLVAGAG